MKIRINSIVEYKTPNPDEILNGKSLQYKVTEINGDRLYIVALGLNLPYPPVTLALLSDVKVVTF